MAVFVLSFLTVHLHFEFFLDLSTVPFIFSKLEKTENNYHGIDNKLCSMQFADKCPINPLVKYWDDVTDCYVSPFRYINGIFASTD